MDHELPRPWRQAISFLDFVFQPIATFAVGSVHGYEALLRGWDEAGVTGIAQVFDLA